MKTRSKVQESLEERFKDSTLCRLCFSLLSLFEFRC